MVVGSNSIHCLPFPKADSNNSSFSLLSDKAERRKREKEDRLQKQQGTEPL